MEVIKTKWNAITGKKTEEEEEIETKKGVAKARVALMMATVGAAAFAGPALLAPKLNDELWWEEEFQSDSYAKLSYPWLGFAMTCNTISLVTDMKAPSRRKLMIPAVAFSMSNALVMKQMREGKIKKKFGSAMSLASAATAALLVSSACGLTYD